MSQFKLEQRSENLNLKLEVEGDKNDAHLLKDAIVLLVESAPVDFWIKDEGNPTPDSYWAAILTAVAQNYGNELPVPPEDASIPDLLRQLIDELEGAGDL